jgi:nucleotide-binding universal stress UspA family protein
MEKRNMFDHILFPTDFSEHSLAVKSQVESVARRFGSKVTLMHVFEIPLTWGITDLSFGAGSGLHQFITSAKERLAKYPLDLPDTQVERVLMEGNPASHIAERVSWDPTDLIMMGSHGYGKLHRVLIGSVTAKVMHDVTCPVWTDSNLYRQDGRWDSIRSIICAVQLDDEAVPLLRYARDVGREFNANVRLVHIMDEEQTRRERSFDFDLHQYLFDSARIEISKLQREAGTEFPVSIGGSAISDTVVDATDVWSADLVVIGRGKAHSAFGQLRTHAYDLIRRSPCPVLSYSAQEPIRISSFCSAAHVERYATGQRLLTS